MTLVKVFVQTLQLFNEKNDIFDNFKVVFKILSFENLWSLPISMPRGLIDNVRLKLSPYGLKTTF